MVAVEKLVTSPNNIQMRASINIHKLLYYGRMYFQFSRMGMDQISENALAGSFCIHV